MTNFLPMNDKFDAREIIFHNESKCSILFIERISIQVVEQT